MRISDWSSDVCSSDLVHPVKRVAPWWSLDRSRLDKVSARLRAVTGRMPMVCARTHGDTRHAGTWSDGHGRSGSDATCGVETDGFPPRADGWRKGPATRRKCDRHRGEMGRAHV